MKITRRKMFAGLGLLPVAMIPSKTEKEQEEPQKQCVNCTVNVQGSLIHESQIKNVIEDAVIQAIKRGRMEGRISFSA